MLNPNTHETFAEAYLEGLRDLLQFGQSVGSVKDPLSTASAFGSADRPAIELIGYSFQVNNPFSSLFLCSERVIRAPYCVGLLLWSLAGSNSLGWLSFYNPLARQYSDDDATLCGAFGKRLFAYEDKINQIDAVCARLLKDPNSRRTVAVICTPEDNVRASREYPCCVGVQYFLRNGFLHAVTHMRAQSALIVLPYDAFLFMALQCVIAARLGATAGIYKHIAGTFHIYEDERQQAERVLDNGARPVSIGDISASESDWRQLFEFEEQLRTATSVETLNKITTGLDTRSLRSNSFIDQAKIILQLNALSKLNIRDRITELLGTLRPPLRDLVVASMPSPK